MVVVTSFFYVCGAILMMAYINVNPVYPVWHRYRWFHTVMIMVWPLVVLLGFVVVVGMCWSLRRQR